MKTPGIAFIGFGEVASILSEAMCNTGAKVAAYDVLLDQERGMDTLQQRARITDIRFCPLPEATCNAEYILSTVTTRVAEAAAQSCAAHLKPGQTYVDLNATAPSVKRKIADIVQPTGAAFVEGAILGAVGVTGARTRILTGGVQGAKAAEALAELGLNDGFYSPKIGKASTFKMLRSIFSKGLEALLLEFLIAGKRAGIQDDLWQEITELFSQNTFEKVAANWIQTHATAHKRRHHEMTQVTGVLKELDLDPMLTESTEAFFKRSCALGLDKAFPERPDTMQDVIDFMEQHLRN